MGRRSPGRPARPPATRPSRPRRSQRRHRGPGTQPGMTFSVATRREVRRRGRRVRRRIPCAPRARLRRAAGGPRAAPATQPLRPDAAWTRTFLVDWPARWRGAPSPASPGSRACRSRSAGRCRGWPSGSRPLARRAVVDYTSSVPASGCRPAPGELPSLEDTPTPMQVPWPPGLAASNRPGWRHVGAGRTDRRLARRSRLVVVCLSRVPAVTQRGRSPMSWLRRQVCC